MFISHRVFSVVDLHLSEMNFLHLISDGHTTRTLPPEYHTILNYTLRNTHIKSSTWTWHISAGIFSATVPLQMCPCNYHLRNSCVWVYVQVCVQVSLITCSGWNRKINSWCYCYANSALWKGPFRDYLYVLCVCVFPRSQHMWTCRQWRLL